MKRCPNCNDFALYDDNVLTCPICETNLVTYSKNTNSSLGSAEGTKEPIRPNNVNKRNNSANASRQVVPEFERRSGLRYHYRGTITEISSHSRLHTKLKKWVNAIFRDEPYQLGNTSHETIIRIEEFHDGHVAGRKRDLIYYGDVEGRFNYGDDVNITAKRRGDRYIVTKMYLNETDSRVRTGPQIPAVVIAFLTLILLIAIAFIIAGIVSLITSGVLMELIEKAITIVVVIAALWLIIRGLFRK